MNNSIQPIEVIRIEIEDTPARDAVIIGRPFNWARAIGGLVLYTSTAALAFLVGGYLADWLSRH